MRNTIVRLLVLLCLLLAGCKPQPDDAAMELAIGDYVGRAEDYPRQYLKADNFVFRNLQEIDAKDVLSYRIEAEFDFIYGADGATIVAALKAAEREKQAKEKRRSNNVIKEFALQLRDLFKSQGYELRFADVKAGDKDHYRGEFTLVRNEDGSWRVAKADYE